MPIVVEVSPEGSNVFKTGANFLTYDDPSCGLVGYRIFWTTGEAIAAYRMGADIFGEYGPQGYKAFIQFERFLQDQAIIPKPELQKVKKPDRRYARRHG